MYNNVAEQSIPPTVPTYESSSPFSNYLLPPHGSLSLQQTLSNPYLCQLTQMCSFPPLGQVSQDNISRQLAIESILGSKNNNSFHNLPNNQQFVYDGLVSAQYPLLLFNNNHASTTDQQCHILNSFQGLPSLGYNNISFQKQFQQQQQDPSSFPNYFQVGLPQQMIQQLSQGCLQNPVDTSQETTMIPQVLSQVTNLPFQMFQTKTQQNQGQLVGVNLQPALRYSPIIQELPPKCQSPRIRQPSGQQPSGKRKGSAWKQKNSRVSSKIPKQVQSSQDKVSNQNVNLFSEEREKLCGSSSQQDKSKEQHELKGNLEIEWNSKSPTEDPKSTLICESHTHVSSFDQILRQEQQQQCTLDDAQRILKNFWGKHQELVYRYVDSCLDRSQYEHTSEFQEVFNAVNLNTFAVTRIYNKKQIPEHQQKGCSRAEEQSYDGAVAGFLEEDALNNHINVQLKTEEGSMSSLEKSMVNSPLIQKNSVNNILLNGSSTFISPAPARSASGSTTTNNTSSKSSSSISQKPSRFQNLTKLLMYKIFKIFGESSHFDFLKINQQVLKILPVIMKRLKDNARDKSKQSDFINHSHYRALFLRLTTDSLGMILSKPDRNKDICNHRELFFVDLLNYDELDLSYCNILKRIMFKVFELFSCDQENNLDGAAVTQGHNMDRVEYLQLAKRGIRLMQKGKVIHSFDLKQQQKE